MNPEVIFKDTQDVIWCDTVDTVWEKGERPAPSPAYYHHYSMQARKKRMGKGRILLSLILLLRGYINGRGYKRI